MTERGLLKIDSMTYRAGIGHVGTATAMWIAVSSAKERPIH